MGIFSGCPACDISTTCQPKYNCPHKLTIVVSEEIPHKCLLVPHTLEPFAMVGRNDNLAVCRELFHIIGGSFLPGDNVIICAVSFWIYMQVGMYEMLQVNLVDVLISFEGYSPHSVM